MKPHDYYQPSKTELEEAFHMLNTLETLAKAPLAQVHMVEDPGA